MRSFQLLICCFLLLVLAAPVQATPKMRPYSGIGVLQFSTTGLLEAIPLYDDPGISRSGWLEPAAARNLNGWLFGLSGESFLLVTARKSEWLEVEYDDAGRTAWLTPERRWQYLPWEQFLKGKLALFLRNSPKKQMQVVASPGLADGVPLTTRQPMKIIMTQGDWAYVLLNQHSAGWIRWRDSDGRLLIGFDTFTAK